MTLEVLNTEEKIKNAKYNSSEELIEAYYFYIKQNYVPYELHQYILEKYKKFNLSISDFTNAMDDFSDLYDRRIDSFATKIDKTTFIRRLTKNLAKNIEKNISQTKLKRLISISLSLTISNISNLCYKMKFDDETLENLFDIISNENLLKNEFEGIIIRSIQDTSLHMNEEYVYEQCYTDKLAQFYFDYYYNDQLNFVQIKKEMNEVLNMTGLEIRDYCNKLEENQINAKTIQAGQEEHDQSINELTESIMPTSHTNELNVTEKDIDKEQFRSIIENDDFVDNITTAKKIFEKTREVVNKYFMYEGEEDELFLKECFTKTTKAYFHIKDKSNDNFYKKCAIYLFDCFETYEDNVLGEDEDDEGIQRYLITRDFLLFLTHNLLNGSEEFKNDLLKLCNEILNKNLVSANDYTEFMNELDVLPHILSYSPSQLHECVIVMAAFMEMDNDKSIMRKIKRLFIKYYKELNDQLVKTNLKEHEWYYEDNSPLCIKDRLHECAVTFILNYLKDPIYITPMSALIYEYEDVIEESGQFYRHNETMIDKVGAESEIKNIDILKKSYKYYKEIDNLIIRTDKIDMGKIEDEITTKYNILYISSIQKNYMYDYFFDCKYMLKKYQRNLAFALAFEVGQTSIDFINSSDEDKILILWELSIQVSLIKEVYSSYDLIPKVMNLSKDDYTNSLEKNIEELKQQVKAKDTDNLTLKNQIRSLNEIIRQENKNHNNEIEKSYNNEIHNLNKTIAVQQKRIKELEENQDELHKLRTLMFELNNREDNYEKDEINYEEKLLEISNNKKIVFVGGHIKLLSMLKEKYSNMIFLENKNNVSRDTINNADYIFFFYNFLNHGLYHKIMSIINSNSQIKWDYLGSKNIELVEKEICNKV